MSTVVYFSSGSKKILTNLQVDVVPTKLPLKHKVSLDNHQQRYHPSKELQVELLTGNHEIIASFSFNEVNEETVTLNKERYKEIIENLLETQL